MSENPPAFPRPESGKIVPEPSQEGMTLRDWFAGQVLASASALPFSEGDYLHRAKVAYAQADAMLKERSNG